MKQATIWLSAWLLMAGLAWAQDPLIVRHAAKNVTLSGYTRSRAKQVLASEVPGKVLQVNYDVGQTIGKKPFLQIDTTFIDFQIAQTQTTLDKLMVARLKASSHSAFLQKEFERIETLHQGNVATLSRWEAAAEELAQARLSLQATDAEIKALKTQLSELKERQRRHQVYAPVGWIVVERRVEPGEIIAAGTPFGQAADFTQLVVPLYVSSQELEAIRKIESLSVKVEGRPVNAVVNWVNPEFDERTRKLGLELALADFKGNMRGGLLTELKVEIPGDGLMVPKAAVTHQYDNPCVTLKSDGRSVPVVLMGENGDYVLIAGHAMLAPGMELQVGNAARPPLSK